MKQSNTGKYKNIRLESIVAEIKFEWFDSPVENEHPWLRAGTISLIHYSQALCEIKEFWNSGNTECK